MTVAERLANLLTPPAPYQADPAELGWTPPALSAAATAPTPRMSPQVARDTPQEQTWQERAWAFYRTSGPAREAVDWLANGLSRMRLYIGEIRADAVGDPERLDDPGLAGEILDELHDGQIGQRDMLHKLAIHLQVPGESWLIGYPAPPKPGEQDATPATADSDADGDGQQGAGQRTAWQVCSRREWSIDTPDQAKVRIKVPRHPNASADGWIEFPSDEVVVIPIYQPDPEDSTRPTSRFEAAMEDLNELDGLSRRTAADIKSRLTGSGLLLLPESATMPNPAMSESDGSNPLHGNPLVHGLIDAASRAIQDPDAASARIPVVAQIADEALAKLQHVDFTTAFDAQVPVLRQAARKNVAVALDVPSTVVTGIEELNHWSAWTVNDDAVRTHLGPLASLVCVTLTREVLWPALREAGEPDPERLVIWWDATEIIQRPDRSTEALNAYKEGVISGEAARRELGFSEEDAPGEAERAERAGPSANELAQRVLGRQNQLGPGGLPGGQADETERPEPPNPDQQ